MDHSRPVTTLSQPRARFSSYQPEYAPIMTAPLLQARSAFFFGADVRSNLPTSSYFRPNANDAPHPTQKDRPSKQTYSCCWNGGVRTAAVSVVDE